MSHLSVSIEEATTQADKAFEFVETSLVSLRVKLDTIAQLLDDQTTPEDRKNIEVLHDKVSSLEELIPLPKPPEHPKESKPAGSTAKEPGPQGKGAHSR